MLNSRRFILLGALLAVSGPFAFADTLSLGSFATGTTAGSLGFTTSQSAMNFAGYTAVAPSSLSNSTATTFTLSPNGVWGTIAGNSAWVGVASTAGPGGTSPAAGYYQFTTTFNATGGAYSGNLSILADDTAEVFLDGVLLQGFGTLGSDAKCADTGINCRAATFIPLSAVTLNSGSNTLTFVVEQAGVIGTGNPSGVNFRSSLQSLATPEPDGLLLLGTGMLGAASFCRRRRSMA